MSKLKRMWIACAESKDDAFTANRAAMGDYLLEHAYEIIELQDAARKLSNYIFELEATGRIVLTNDDMRAVCAFDAALAKLEE
jgi:hypothetical protein